ncbi:hypothetical protein JYU23_00950 [bacterium AH-315-C07]|nr:hypothetical protein [bacterium AH-315-C07]
MKMILLFLSFCFAFSVLPGQTSSDINLHLDKPHKKLKKAHHYYLAGAIISCTGSMLALYAQGQIPELGYPGDGTNNKNYYQAMKYTGIGLFGIGVGTGVLGHKYVKKNYLNVSDIWE